MLIDEFAARKKIDIIAFSVVESYRILPPLSTDYLARRTTSDHSE